MPKSRTLRSHKRPHPSNQSKPRKPQTHRIHNLFHLPNPTQPGKISTISTIHLRQNLAKIGYATSATILILALLWLADTCKGYDVHKINDDTYQIDVVITRADAETLQKKMEDSNINYWPLRDVRLPGGILATGIITSTTVQNFLDSAKEQTIIRTTWRLSEHRGIRVNQDLNLITVYVNCSYRELLDALQTLHANNTDMYMLDTYITLPGGNLGYCHLRLDELESYTRRIHRIGANCMIIPFHFQYDTGLPITNIPRII